MDNRLIPHAEYVVGGLYTVRGYPENALAGDTTLVFTTEYRFYVPRAVNPWAGRTKPTADQVAERARTAGGQIDVFGRKFRYTPSLHGNEKLHE